MHQFFRLFRLSAQPRCLTKLVKTSKTAGLQDRVFFKGLPWEMWAILHFACEIGVLADLSDFPAAFAFAYGLIKRL